MDTEWIFEWDERKRRSNLSKHRLDFADCRAVFRGRVLTCVDGGDDYGEVRFLTRGLLRSRVVVVAHTEVRNVIRVISMRRAATHEEADYFENAFPD